MEFLNISCCLNSKSDSDFTQDYYFVMIEPLNLSKTIEINNVQRQSW